MDVLPSGRAFTYEHDEMPEGAFSVSEATSLDGVSMHGYVARDLWAVVCDHRSGMPWVGVLPAAEVRDGIGEPLYVESDGLVDDSDETLIIGAIARAVRAGRCRRPTGTGTLPADWDLSNDERWAVAGTGGSYSSVYLPVDPTYNLEDGWGAFSGSVDVDGHSARWGHVFDMAAPGGDAPESGFAVWDHDLLIAAGRCDDMDDEGFVAFALTHGPGSTPDEAREWGLALLRAIIMRGVPLGGDVFSLGVLSVP